MNAGEMERKIALLQACWAHFDEVAARVSAKMRKGPRGGGRDRDRIVRHTIRTESEDFAAGEGRRMRSWTLPFLIRHSAYHVMDHVWEMEDKDLS